MGWEGEEDNYNATIVCYDVCLCLCSSMIKLSHSILPSSHTHDCLYVTTNYSLIQLDSAWAFNPTDRCSAADMVRVLNTHLMGP